MTSARRGTAAADHPNLFTINWPEMLCVASLVCLTNQRTPVFGDLLFSYLTFKYNMPLDFFFSPCVMSHLAESLFLSLSGSKFQE